MDRDATATLAVMTVESAVQISELSVLEVQLRGEMSVLRPTFLFYRSKFLC